MGDQSANANFRTPGKGTDPITGDYEFYFHWGDESLEELTVISKADASDLMDDSEVSQAQFDTTAASVVTWYGFTSLNAAEKTQAREACRKAFRMVADLCV